MLNNTKLLIINKSLKKLNKLLNIDLKNVRNSLQTHHVDYTSFQRGIHVVCLQGRLNSNNISRNVSKIELLILNPKK